MEEEEAPLLPLAELSELPDVVVASEVEDEREEERVAVALDDELPATTLETAEEREAVALPLAVAVAEGAAVTLAAAVAAAAR